MTDKQMAEKKKEFFERFTESHDGGIEAGEYYLWKSNDSAGKVWQWISKLVEEVEREGYKKGLIDQSIRDITN